MSVIDSTEMLNACLLQYINSSCTVYVAKFI